jgi:hypothetical protein
MVRSILAIIAAVQNPHPADRRRFIFNQATLFRSLEPEVCMRKMIMMALAGFIWKQIQSRVFKRADTGRAMRR